MIGPGQLTAERSILRALDMLKPEHCGPLNLCRLAGLGKLRGSLAIVRLDHAGLIEQVRSPADDRATVYRRVPSTTSSDQ